MKPLATKILAAVGALLLAAVVLKPFLAGSGNKPQETKPKQDEDVIALSSAALEKNPIKTAKVTKAKLASDLLIVGSVSYDQDLFAVVGPLVPGRVVSLRAGVGDVVKAGQVLAEVESADVGQAQGAYFSASARAKAAEANVRRERDLAEKRISSERDRELAEAQAVSEAAEVRAAVERLRAFGLARSDVAALERGTSTSGRVPLRAPIDGTVVWRGLTLGQAVERATDGYKIVNLSHLWVQLDLYERDLRRVHVGQQVELRTEAYTNEVFRARVAYVNPLIDEKTRTANVRIEFDNPDGKLNPGQFVTARLLGDATRVEHETLTVPRRAVATVEGRSVVFLREQNGFRRQYVEIGLSGGDLLEIKQGVSEGQEVATDGAFLLKSELLR